VVDPDGGDRIPRAFVVLKADAQNQNTSPDVIRAFVDDRVAPYKKLRGGLYTISALPRNKTGKISRADCVNMSVPAPAC
jgi:acyl-coenzyme A synthetase/AMP-(fatty) acid ligase